MDEERRKKRAVSEGVKIGSNALISITLVAVLVLSDMFTLDNFKIEMANATYWVSKILTTIGTFCLMIAFSNIVEGAKIRKDKELNDNLDHLDEHYKNIMDKGYSDKLELFILNKNKISKYQVFIEKWKKKLKYYEKHQDENKRLYAQKKLILSVDEVWDEERVKFTKITTPQLFSGATDVPSKFGEDDIQVRRGYFAAKKLSVKMLSLVAGSVSISDLVYSFQDWSNSMWFPLIMRIIVILMAIYSGVCFGSFIVERIKITLKTKLKILSQFRARNNGDGVFDIQPEKDLVVEKAKNELKPLQKTIADTFGAGQPVKVGTFATQLVKNAVDYEADKVISS